MTAPGLDAWREVCSRCGQVWALADRRWTCRCGGLLDLVGPLADPLGATGSMSEGGTGGAGGTGGPGGAGGAGGTGGAGGASVSPLARYAAALPPGSGSVDLGLTVTRAVEVTPAVWVKADYEQPTGSFKDRGASVMIGVALRLGVDSIVVDSSGNAGKAAAAHAARAGMACVVYLPAGTAATKVEAMAGYGAEVVEVPGGRQAAADAAQRDLARSGRWYASHVHQPLFHHGVKTLAFELFEQVKGLSAGTVFVPTGNGTLVLGLWLGFGELVALGRMARRPAIVAVQAEACAPLAGLTPDATGSAGGRVAGTAAAGIAIPTPARAGQIRGAVLASGGRVMVVGEEAISAARSELAESGFEVEPTGAVAWAGLRAWGRDEGGGRGDPGRPAVAVLTGS